MPTATRLCVRRVLGFGLLLVLVAGCSSEPEGGRRSGLRGRHGNPPIPLAGQETFFDGRIVAALSVGPVEGFGGGAPDENRGAPGGGRGVGGGRGRHGGGGMNHGGGMGGGHGSRGGNGDAPHDFNGEGDGGERAGPRPMMGRLGPPVMIHLRFTNQGPGPVKLLIADFSSPLGNFAVQPESLALEPGQSVETEPMSSQLADSLVETDATLVLRIGNQTEKKLVVLRAVTPAATAGPPPGGAAASPGQPAR